MGTGALQATLDLAHDYADAAKASLSLFPASEWRAALEDLAELWDVPIYAHEFPF